MNARTALGMVGVAVVFVLGMAVEALRSAGPARPASDPTSARELAEIRALLERVVERGEARLPGVGPSPSPVRSAEDPGGPSGADDVRSALAALRDEIAAQGRSTREALRGGGLALDDLRALRPRPDPVALEEFAREYGQHSERAQMTMKMKSVREVIERFGTPDTAWPTDRGFSLSYYRPGTTDTWVWITIDHGLVGHIEVDTK